MKAILTDVTKCIGCEKCVQGCKEVNSLPEDVPFRWRLQDGLNSTRWTTVLHTRTGAYVRKQCRHCLEPACTSACPVGALTRTDSGAVVYDESRCMGCRYCMMACPFGIPRYEWESTVPYVRKCSMCFERQMQGKQPGCTEACPEKATIFGDRDALLAEARRRIEDDPSRYIGKVWGESDVGGTAVLYLSHVPLDFLALGRGGGDTPMPQRTAAAMHAVPFAFVGMGVLMGGLYWVIDRRNRMAGSGGQDQAVAVDADTADGEAGKEE